jgi:tRNA-(ms[2]io[6]A)-hydroxylase
VSLPATLADDRPGRRDAAPANAVGFLRCATPQAWIEAAAGDLDLLLQDHATLELKAAAQAQRLIRQYGAGGEPFRANLLASMSRLAREELRHFEQVVDILDARGPGYRPVTASRYAAGLHALVRSREPCRLIDTLLVGAVIEARSCERFASLAPALETVEPALARFYASLLRSEARHYRDYLELARAAALFTAHTAGSDPEVDARLDMLLARDAELICTSDTELRFHSGVPTTR